MTDLAESHTHNPPNKPATLHTFTSFNAFGLFHRYEIRQMFLAHDPDEYVLLIDLSNIPTHTNVAQPTFSPYPNRSSFLLGDWYWNGSVQKLQQSFNDLIKIITDSEFQIMDIQNVNWTQIDEELASDNLKEKGRKVPVLCRSDSGYSRVLLPFEGTKNHVARPLSPSIVRKRKMYPKIDAKWRDLSVRRGFRLKMETRWRDFPAKVQTQEKCL